MGKVRFHGAMRDPTSIRDMGTGLAFVGVVVLMMHFMWSGLCNGDLMGPCISQPYSGRQGFLALIGTGMLVAGSFLALFGHLATRAKPTVRSFGV
jgi:hypothetical protein